MVYPEDLPDDWARIIEIEENEKRQDLTADERAAHTVELAAQLKKLEELTRSENRTKSDFTAEPRPRTGRGHKGLVQKTAEKQKIDHATVRKRARKVAVVIGEPVDLEGDSPLRAAAQGGEVPGGAAGKAAQRAGLPHARRGGAEGARGRAAPLTVLAELNAALDQTYALFGAHPYSAVAELALEPRPDGRLVKMLRLYPILTDNLVTGYRGRFVTEDEYEEVSDLLTARSLLRAASFGAMVRHGRNGHGRFLEMQLD